MVDVVDAGAAPAETPAEKPAEAPAAVPAAAAASAAPPTVATGEKPPVTDGGTPPADKPEAEGPAQWRTDLNPTGDAEVAKMLARYNSPANVAKALRAAQLKISTGDLRPKLGEGATEAEIAAYRKAEGIPEKWEDYTIPVPATRPLDDVEKTIIDDFRKQAHGLNVPPTLAKSLTEWFLGVNDTQAQVMRDRALEARQKTEDTLRTEWGPEYRSNIAAVNTMLAERMGDAGPALLQKQFTDGTRLGDDPVMVRFLADLARENYGDSYNFDAAAGGGGGKSVDEQIADGLKMMTSADPAERKRYHSDDFQKKMEALYQRKAKGQR